MNSLKDIYKLIKPPWIKKTATVLISSIFFLLFLYIYLNNYPPLLVSEWKTISYDEALIQIESGYDVNITYEKSRGILERFFRNPLPLDKQSRQTPLFYVIYNTNDKCEMIIECLLDAGANVNHKDNNGLTPLFHAVKYAKNSTIIDILVKHGADTNIKDNHHRTPLMYSIYRLGDNFSEDIPFKKEIFDVLVSSEIDLETVDKEGKTAIFHAIQCKNNYAAKILINKQVKLDIQDKSGKTPLQFAILNKNSLDIIRLLLEHHAYSNYPSEYQISLQKNALKEENIELLRLLLRYGSKTNFKDNEGKTILMYALNRGERFEIIDEIISAGADPFLVDSNGLNALDYAKSNKIKSKIMDSMLKKIKQGKFIRKWAPDDFDPYSVSEKEKKHTCGEYCVVKRFLDDMGFKKEMIEKVEVYYQDLCCNGEKGEASLLNKKETNFLFNLIRKHESKGYGCKCGTDGLQYTIYLKNGKTLQVSATGCDGDMIVNNGKGRPDDITHFIFIGDYNSKEGKAFNKSIDNIVVKPKPKNKNFR